MLGGAPNRSSSKEIVKKKKNSALGDEYFFFFFAPSLPNVKMNDVTIFGEKEFYENRSFAAKNRRQNLRRANEIVYATLFKSSNLHCPTLDYVTFMKKHIHTCRPVKIS